MLSNVDPDQLTFRTLPDAKKWMRSGESALIFHKCWILPIMQKYSTAHCREMVEYPEEGSSICSDSIWLVSRMAGLTTTESPGANEEQRPDGNAHVTRETADLIQQSLISMRDARNPARTLFSARNMAKLSKTRLAGLPSAISVCDYFIRKKQSREYRDSRIEQYERCRLDLARWLDILEEFPDADQSFGRLVDWCEALAPCGCAQSSAVH